MRETPERRHCLERGTPRSRGSGGGFPATAQPGSGHSSSAKPSVAGRRRDGLCGSRAPCNRPPLLPRGPAAGEGAGRLRAPRSSTAPAPPRRLLSLLLLFLLPSPEAYCPPPPLGRPGPTSRALRPESRGSPDSSARRPHARSHTHRSPRSQNGAAPSRNAPRDQTSREPSRDPAGARGGARRLPPRGATPLRSAGGSSRAVTSREESRTFREGWRGNPLRRAPPLPPRPREFPAPPSRHRAESGSHDRGRR